MTRITFLIIIIMVVILVTQVVYPFFSKSVPYFWILKENNSDDLNRIEKRKKNNEDFEAKLDKLQPKKKKPKIKKNE